MDLGELFEGWDEGRPGLPDWKTTLFIVVAVAGVAVALSLDDRAIGPAIMLTVVGLAPGVLLVSIAGAVKGASKAKVLTVGRGWQALSLVAVGLLVGWAAASEKSPDYEGLGASICEHVAGHNGETLWALMGAEAQKEWSPASLTAASETMTRAWRGAAPAMSVANGADPTQPHLICSNATGAAGHAEVSFRLGREHGEWVVETMEFVAR